MIKIIIIDPQHQTITNAELSGEGEVERLDAMQKIVAGTVGRSIELAMEIRAPNGGVDDLYVNEEGLFEPTFHFFEFHGGHQPFAGPGFLIGTEDGSGIGTDVNFTLAEVVKRVRFRHRSEIGNFI
jgi:hypothetical protein